MKHVNHWIILVLSLMISSPVISGIHESDYAYTQACEELHSHKSHGKIGLTPFKASQNHLPMCKGAIFNKKSFDDSGKLLSKAQDPGNPCRCGNYRCNCSRSKGSEFFNCNSCDYDCSCPKCRR